ncbi:RRS1-domain-containing protein [Pseudovirgaria hyperparasitica]|uniref:Ribosome biogenesis regulatory protein n=1 Tax=Pseudovirgaria hyperparasitica TaxID=470096 RepID=A0A6A6WBK0_9PEZI|nr:RRS1-domain-containing protein [Pseudovirgaria hyperparasitica]KAF2759340.1 RRS1-domain-containing protein [Pseudovirgaria hyperparasitica]
MTETKQANGTTEVEIEAHMNGDAMEMDQVATAIDAVADDNTGRPSVNVNKPTPYTFDLGNLLAFDPNPLPHNIDEDVLASTARDCAQVLINQLLTTCPIQSTSEGVLLDLPAPSTPIPREKPVPKAKEPTKWELFAAKKGIKDKKRDTKMVFDEEKQDWVPKWGYKGKNKDMDEQWLVEVDEKKEAETGVAHDARKEGRAERKERMKRQDRRERANEKRGAKKV